MPQLLGVFEQPHDIAAAARRLRDRGFTDIETTRPRRSPRWKTR